MRELIDRAKDENVPAEGVWYKYGEWSVVNLKEMMKNALFDTTAGEEFFWEALLPEDNTDGWGSEVLRAETWEELKERIHQYEQSNT